MYTIIYTVNNEHYPLSEAVLYVPMLSVRRGVIISIANSPVVVPCAYAFVYQVQQPASPRLMQPVRNLLSSSQQPLYIPSNYIRNSWHALVPSSARVRTTIISRGCTPIVPKLCTHDIFRQHKRCIHAPVRQDHFKHLGNRQEVETQSVAVVLRCKHDISSESIGPGKVHNILPKSVYVKIWCVAGHTLLLPCRLCQVLLPR